MIQMVISTYTLSLTMQGSLLALTLYQDGHHQVVKESLLRHTVTMKMMMVIVAQELFIGILKVNLMPLMMMITSLQNRMCGLTFMRIYLFQTGTFSDHGITLTTLSTDLMVKT